ncbi:uncharacterized protein CXQ87_004803 [Candidozyma duobushaemuli]|uniref:Peroxidase n=1 Tax=Candidozyma duobushaemuli TaxID=1231522 RepID=A0A2V1AEK6_9ASCO|nr:uncharacterized protein CXQ87_004803 [[Candida] duobushaemulonis]PVH16510.1 hypothetical protein CXQ87_004803 [[Candida] duobushaemulonis]
MASIVFRSSAGSKNSYSKILSYAAAVGGAATATAGALYLHQQQFGGNNNKPPQKNNGLKFFAAATPAKLAQVFEGKTEKDFQEVYNAIAQKVQDEDDADEGAGRYGLLCRLAWHSSGTYDKKKNSGGSYSGSMIYSPESTDPENAGLDAGRDFLNEFHYEFPWLSRGDLWTLGGVVAVQEAGGPKIKWRPGRVDCSKSEKDKIPENGNLPDASQESGAYVRKIFNRLGFDDREMDDETSSFMMLPTDMVLKEDSKFLKYVKLYAADQDLFFADFSKAFTRLLENGIEFAKDTPYYEFKTLEEQE